MEEKVAIIILDEDGIEEGILLLPMSEINEELSLSQMFENENTM